jgi:hypothetical protein
VLSAASPAKIILSASADTGEMTSDSDIDFLTVENESARRHDQAYAQGSAHTLGRPLALGA